MRPRFFLDVRGIRPFAFKEAVAVNPIDSPLFRRFIRFLFFLVARYILFIRQIYSKSLVFKPVLLNRLDMTRIHLNLHKTTNPNHIFRKSTSTD